ncbi:hypothetical protein [Streptomyces sp. DH41]|uniref:hypothetical protein n=1 Tax=Streptomyces sp. DH41 TaxID=3040125 RepID=UPI002441B7C0|nr:hypothetical protein [Streptomyces sp. DH41]MDG9725086.1 hypothetical protein [Streptomyces sp. DH41]
MTTTPSPPSLVLRGRDATARVDADGDHLTWRQDGTTHRIPLRAVEVVRAAGEGRTLEIVLTAPPDRGPAVYEVTEVSAAGALAFVEAVHARLPARDPGEPRADGKDLVTTDEGRSPTRRWPSGRVIGVLAAIAVAAALDVAVGTLGGGGQIVGAMIFFQVFGVIGVLILVLTGEGLYYARRLPKHGITVVAEFDHFTNSTRVYRYTDHHGTRHFYRDSAGGSTLELSFDPRRPERAAARLHPAQQIAMLAVALLGLTLSGWGSGFTLYQFYAVLTG